MKKQLHTIAFFIAATMLTTMVVSCKKETNYIFEVEDVDVTQPGGGNDRVKTTVEFISIAYSDLFNATIPSNALDTIQQAYEAFGDKKLIEDRIVRHFLISPNVQIPDSAAMRANVPEFVDQTIRKFFNRKPDAFEKYFISKIIQDNTSIMPELVYYTCMTSDEYRYY